MKSRYAVEGRLEGLQMAYRAVSSDNIDPKLEARIRELKWVLEYDEKYISHDG